MFEDNIHIYDQTCLRDTCSSAVRVVIIVEDWSVIIRSKKLFHGFGDLEIGSATSL
jgi:hypothetical protein